ncbi:MULTISPECIES: phosphatidylglycerophosphatase A [Salinivibrio]|uniref:Phosphatidylglycerophosphatase A n=1 Tax=Salinivibrio proteolyticus TaxID=334715 RepID=A0ABY7LF15_9GAMM|nr:MULTISPECIES: phosphatidylglycerophosphatase A [Salinivibrio]ODP99724.1 phosphatidylglycerophosphatase A [Salinivibrio sp. DV]OOF23913.1 phosphatidylglycerophosphatase A [Salinivibrio sp. IB574]OOF28562.1 phosphatidylglycerophosphatase A [Salinivibrio sp. IB872]PCE67899.1 phosphatidylglycerophosphatase A [Salinivibrio sp. YCSC6]QCF35206.1 phosphatidylglycerophosphatase A [Salinivibrio sp. YCSC6]
MTDPKQRLSLKNPLHLLAVGLGSGLSPVVPGTVGTLFAVPFYWLLATYTAPVGLWIAILVGSLAGIVICGRTSADMKVHDHGAIVWDEFVGFWITMALVPSTDWQIILAGFVMFRLFDMIKPWPISWLDKHVHGGLGIMLDDILAGVMAMLSLWAWVTYV